MKTIKYMKGLNKYSDIDLFKELEKRGYGVMSSVHISSVKEALDELNEDNNGSFEISDHEAMEILNESYNVNIELDRVEDAIQSLLTDKYF